MSFLGKALVVFQVATSIVFMLFAAGVYTSHMKWKQKYDAQVAVTSKAQNDLRTEQGEHEKTRRSLTDAKTQAETERDEARFKLATAEQEVAAAKAREAQRLAESAANQQQAAIAGEESEARRQETQILRELNQSLLESRNELARTLSQTQDELKSAQINLDSAATRNKELIRDNARMVQALARHKISVDDLADAGSPPPRVDGVVLNTQPARGAGGSELVTISLGADDRFRKGHRLDVYRPSASAGGAPKYLGKIEIIRTLPDQAVGIVVDRAGNGTLQKGDIVTTKL